MSTPPAPPSVIVSVSVALTLASAIVTLAKGFTGASDVVVWPALAPVIVGATAGSLSITLAVVVPPSLTS